MTPTATATPAPTATSISTPIIINGASIHVNYLISNIAWDVALVLMWAVTYVIFVRIRQMKKLRGLRMRFAHVVVMMAFLTIAGFDVSNIYTDYSWIVVMVAINETIIVISSWLALYFLSHIEAYFVANSALITPEWMVWLKRLWMGFTLVGGNVLLAVVFAENKWYLEGLVYQFWAVQCLILGPVLFITVIYVSRELRRKRRTKLVDQLMREQGRSFFRFGMISAVFTLFFGIGLTVFYAQRITHSEQNEAITDHAGFGNRDELDDFTMGYLWIRWANIPAVLYLLKLHWIPKSSMKKKKKPFQYRKKRDVHYRVNGSSRDLNSGFSSQRSSAAGVAAAAAGVHPSSNGSLPRIDTDVSVAMTTLTTMDSAGRLTSTGTVGTASVVRKHSPRHSPTASSDGAVATDDGQEIAVSVSADGGAAERVRSGTRMTYLPLGTAPSTLYTGSISSGRVRVMRYSQSRTMSSPALRHNTLSALYMKKAVQEYNSAEDAKSSFPPAEKEEKSAASSSSSGGEKSAAAENTGGGGGDAPSTNTNSGKTSNLTVANMSMLGPPTSTSKSSRRSSVASVCSMASIAEEDPNVGSSDDDDGSERRRRLRHHQSPEEEQPPRTGARCRSVSLSVEPSVVDAAADNGVSVAAALGAAARGNVTEEEMSAAAAASTELKSSVSAAAAHTQRSVSSPSPARSPVSRTPSRSDSPVARSRTPSIERSTTEPRRGSDYEELSRTSVVRSESCLPLRTESTQILISIDNHPAASGEMELP